MNIQFYAKNFELTQDLKALFTKKLEKLKKYKQSVEVLNVRADISQDAHHHKGDVFRVEINVDVPKKKVLRAVEQSADIRTALDAILSKLERQMRDEKERYIGQRKSA